jgi:molybdopterin/thiamine biosynthesis adenylyltransferase/ubiquitin-protein ligase
MPENKSSTEEIISDIPGVSRVEPLTGFNERGVDPEFFMTFRVLASYEEQEWNLFVSIPKNFPISLPRIHLENAQDYLPMGHVNWQGNICYKDEQGLVADIRNPEKVLTGCLMETLRTLHQHYNDASRHDLWMDYEHYWESLPAEFHVTMCLIEQSDDIKMLTGYLDHKKERKTKIPTFLAIHDKESKVNVTYWPLAMLQKRKQTKVLYIPLIKPVMPPSPMSTWTCQDIAEIVHTHASLEVTEKAKLWSEEQHWSNITGIIFSHPKPAGEKALWGIQFSRNEKTRHPLVAPNTVWKISPIHLQNHSQNYLIRRGGAETALADKKVAVIGCGSVGGNIAVNLAKSGVGELHLFDYDRFYPENMYRHVLGGLYIEPVHPRYKVEQLAGDIMRNHPFVKAVPYLQGLLSVAPWKNENIAYDAVVVATGDFTQELMYNMGHHKCNKAIPVIYAWQEGFGIGGHCMRVGNPDTPGCLECLYTRSAGFKPHPKTSFIKQGQTISQHIGGCGGVMTPYSYLDASQTAILATRSTINVLKGDCSNELCSWKGSSVELETNGYAVSAWYEKSVQGESQDTHRYVAKNCKACGAND